MEQQHESDLVKRLEQLGIEVDVSPTVTTLTYEQIYTSGPCIGYLARPFLKMRREQRFSIVLFSNFLKVYASIFDFL